METTDTIRLEGRAILFGFPSTTAVLGIRSRPTSWRAGGAALRMGAGLVLAGIVMIIPPHAPWLIGALVGGAVMARRRLIERYTLEAVEGTCPKCGEALNVKAGRLRRPHPAMCEGCHHESSLQLPEGSLAD